MAKSDDQDGTEELGEDGESSVIKGLRKQTADDKTELSELRAFKEDAETAAELAVDIAAEGFVNTLGFPDLKDDVKGWVEGVPTLESVTEALQTRGIIKAGEATTPVVPPTEAPAAVIETTSKLGQAVADAALGDPVKGVDERLLATDNIGQLNEIMEELGAVRDYS